MHLASVLRLASYSADQAALLPLLLHTRARARATTCRSPRSSC